MNITVLLDIRPYGLVAKQNYSTLKKDVAGFSKTFITDFILTDVTSC
jgi:hypothetical protein